jgi:gamma-glutamyltranspeptidase/glutathione hydrolase
MENQKVAFTAPHFAAAQAGLSILEKGGTAIEAMVAAAASIAVEYPHMNGLGGDGFWLISEPGKTPIGIDASGNAAKQADCDFYSGLETIPSRGPKAALTMAGAVAGWKKALTMSEQWQKPQPLEKLLGTAINQAEWGIEVTQSLSDASFKTFEQLGRYDGFEQFLIKGKALKKGKVIKLPKLAKTLKTLVKNGLDDFYQGEIASNIAADLSKAGSPLILQDFKEYQADFVAPLSVSISKGKLYNLGAPTQGLASLMILALYDRVAHLAQSDADNVHLLVECTKQAFIVRNQFITDSSRLEIDLSTWLVPSRLDELAKRISVDKAMPWPFEASAGDTVWMGACDNKGRMVSYIQSLYWEFGSGVVSPSTGIVWNNRGTSFSLNPNSHHVLQPRLKPFHTLNPAFAQLEDGRRISYGTMGGEGQPQTQAAIFARHVFHKQPLDKAINLGRWLLGRTWGEVSHNLKLEKDLADYVGHILSEKGHDIAIVEAKNELMGHAGAVVLSPDGTLEAASDPRSDGKGLVAKSHPLSL